MPMFAQRGISALNSTSDTSLLLASVGILTTIWLFWTSFRLLSGRVGSGSLVLQTAELTVDALPDEDVYAEVVGRRHGLVAFLLSLIGFDPITRLLVTKSEVRCQTSSLSGKRITAVPLRQVTQINSGVEKPIAALMIGVLFFLNGFYLLYELRSPAPFLFNLLVSLILVIFYFFWKRFFIEIYSSGGPPIHLRFRPGVLEGMVLGERPLSEAVGVLRDMVNSSGDAPPSGRSGQRARKPRPAGSPRLTSVDEPIIGKERFTMPGDIVEEEAEESEVVDDEHARELFHHAKSLAQSGKQREAIQVLRNIVRKFEGTRYAEKAKLYLKNEGSSKDGSP